MNAKQVTHILKNILKDSQYADGYTPLLNNFMIVLNKDELLYTDINRWRYKFDFTNNLVERILVRPYSHDLNKVPNGLYDSAVDAKTGEVTVYEYLTDKTGHIPADVYMFETIIMFIPQPEVTL